MLQSNLNRGNNTFMNNMNNTSSQFLEKTLALSNVQATSFSKHEDMSEVQHETQVDNNELQSDQTRPINDNSSESPQSHRV